MPFVAEQVTDAVTQSNVLVTGEAPAQSLASLYQSAAHSTGLSMQNAVQAQQQMAQITAATTASAVAQILSAGSASGGKIAQSDVPDNMLSLLAALRASTNET